MRHRAKQSTMMYSLSFVGHSVGGPSQASMRLSKRCTLSMTGSFIFNPGAVTVRTILPKRVMITEEHTSELQSPCNLVCRLLLEKKKKKVLCDEQCTEHRQ